MIRTFIAIDLSDQAAQAVARLQSRLRSELSSVRWVEPNNLHLTLAFLGDVETDRLASLIDAVRDSVRTALPFSLELRGLGAFPDTHRPRVLWAGLTGPSLTALLHLRSDLVTACAGVGYPPGDKFYPHITMARFRPGRVPDVSSLIAERESWLGGIVEVDATRIYASELTPRGPIHREVAHCPLGHPRPAAR